jgi:hypothetical protein
MRGSWLYVLVMTNQRDEKFIQSIPPLREVRARHAVDAPIATKEYEDKVKARLEQMAKLKAERLARKT